MTFSLSVTLGDEWIEPTYDHLHHARALQLLERARLALLVTIGFPNDELLRSGFALVITKIEIAYKREVRRGDVVITCDGGDSVGRTLIIRQRIINERGKEAVSATVESTFMSVETRRGIDGPEDFRNAFRRWVEAGR